MRPTRFALLALALTASAAGVAAAPAPLAAQAAAPTIVRPAVLANDPAVLRPVAVYRFTSTPVRGIPHEVTVADSAGQLVARFRLRGETQDRAMLVVIVGDDLVLQGETPSGVLTIQLREPEAGARRGFVGRWRIEGEEGELRGRVGS